MSIHTYGRLYPYVVPGYTGHIPSNEEVEGGEFHAGASTQIPGYVGYIPHVKPENMHGKTYGKITSAAKKDDVPIGTVITSDFRYTSTMKEAFVNQLEIRRDQSDLTNYPHTMQLTKQMKDTANAGFIRDYDQIKDDKKSPIKASLNDIRSSAYGK